MIYGFKISEKTAISFLKYDLGIEKSEITAISFLKYDLWIQNF